MIRSTLNTKDTTTIESTYSLLQMINIITSNVLAIASAITTVYLAIEDKYLWLIPLVAFVVVVFSAVLVYNHLRIQYGMYYDIRVTRLIAENGNTAPVSNDDALPEL